MKPVGCNKKSIDELKTWESSRRSLPVEFDTKIIKNKMSKLKGKKIEMKSKSRDSMLNYRNQLYKIILDLEFKLKIYESIDFQTK